MHSCKINRDAIWVDGALDKELSDENDWKRNLYNELEIDYPKFHKMDALAKMAFLSFNILMKHLNLKAHAENDVAMIFANSSSSSSTDRIYKDGYETSGSPSPSLFVYTLPNILIGELAIFNKWYGENIFFIQENFDAEFYKEQINFYFSKGSKACLAGWVESNAAKEECLLFFVKDSEEIDIEELNKLYKQ